MRRSGIIGVASIAATLVFASAARSFATAPLPGGTLNPHTIPKYVTPLVIPPEMPATATLPGGIKYYEIAVRQFQQQILPAGLPMTAVWGYGSPSYPGTFHYPAFTIEATADQPLRVKWMNQLVVDPVACAASGETDNACNFLPHLLPIDRTLHWANPEQLMCMDSMTNQTDCRPDPMNGEVLQQPYQGPVPIVVHVHGAHVNPDSDGFPEAWYLPRANNIPAGYASRGSNYGQIPGAPNELGAALFQYRNDQRATTAWFHDHTLGMTRANVYAGPAGFYILRGGRDDLPSEPLVVGGLPGPAPKLGDPPATKYYEIPIAIQDRSFNADGSLFYAGSRAFFDEFVGPYIGDPLFPSDISPIWNPEFFGNVIVVNGKTWPYLNVEPRKYRFRLLNGSESRFFILDFKNNNLKFTQIGSEGGFLPAPVVLDRLLIAPAERADVIVDFSLFKPGDKIILFNRGPDSPFGGFPILGALANPATTGQVMQFRVVPLTAPDTSTIPALPSIVPLGPATNVRRVSLNELESDLVCVDKKGTYIPGETPPSCSGLGTPMGPTEARLGTVDDDGVGIPLAWADTISENPAHGSTEVWEIHNFTEDAHPIHIHEVMFQVVDRTPMGDAIGGPSTRGPESWETGFKDTVVAYPGEVTRIKALFDIAGLFVWHCHILEHEDNEMMRPYCVGDLASCNP